MITGVGLCHAWLKAVWTNWPSSGVRGYDEVLVRTTWFAASALLTMQSPGHSRKRRRAHSLKIRSLTGKIPYSCKCCLKRVMRLDRAQPQCRCSGILSVTVYPALHSSLGGSNVGSRPLWIVSSSLTRRHICNSEWPTRGGHAPGAVE